MSDRRTVGVPWVVSLGFLRLMINDKVLVRPLTSQEALTHIRTWLERSHVQVLQPGPRHLDILADFARQGFLSSALTTDAHWAALAIEHQAELHSNDSDFDRFPGLRRRNPLK